MPSAPPILPEPASAFDVFFDVHITFDLLQTGCEVLTAEDLFNLTIKSSVVPEPSTLALSIAGLRGVAFLERDVGLSAESC